MSLIYVRAKPGRIVRETPSGKLIPGDKFVPVVADNHIMRALDVWGDLERQPIEKAAPAPVAEVKAEKVEAKK